MTPEEHKEIQSGQKPAPTIRLLVDAQRQNLAALGFDFNTVELLLDRAQCFAHVTGAIGLKMTLPLYEAEEKERTELPGDRTEISVVFQEDDWRMFKEALARMKQNVLAVDAKATLAVDRPYPRDAREMCAQIDWLRDELRNKKAKEFPDGMPPFPPGMNPLQQPKIVRRWFAYDALVRELRNVRQSLLALK